MLTDLEEHLQRQRHMACSGYGGGQHSLSSQTAPILPSGPYSQHLLEPAEKQGSTRKERTRQKAKNPGFKF